MATTTPCLHCAIIQAITDHFEAHPDQITENGQIDPADVISALMACVGDVVTNSAGDMVPANVIFAMAAFQSAINSRAAQAGQGTRH